MKIQTPMKLTALLSASLLLSACGSSGGGGGAGGEVDEFSYIELDATDPTMPNRFDMDGHKSIANDGGWAASYQKYIGFAVNGGHSGPGSIKGCIAKKYDALFDAEGKAVASEFRKLTKENTANDFKAVNKDSCGTTEEDPMIEDTLRTEIETGDWLDADYSTGAPVYSAKEDASNGWIIRSSSKVNDAYNYARIKVKTVTVVFGAQTSRKIVLSVENWNGESFEDAVDSPELDFSSSRAFYDMETNTIVAEADDWDISVKVDGRNYPLQVNGGASGNGSGGAGLLLIDNAALVTNPADTQEVYKYFGDSVEGVLSKPGNYGPFQYSVEGNHKMWPTFTTYLFTDGAGSYYKAQVISNYGEDGTAASGNLYIRYASVPN